MNNRTKNEVVLGSLEELKDMLRAMPDGVVISVKAKEEDKDGKRKEIQT